MEAKFATVRKMLEAQSTPATVRQVIAELEARDPGGNGAYYLDTLRQIRRYEIAYALLMYMPQSITISFFHCSRDRNVGWLVSSYRANPKQWIFEHQLWDGIGPNCPAALFVMIVSLCDGLYRLPMGPHTEKVHNACRFFRIAARLPMDVQAVLAYRCFGSNRDIIGCDQTERMLRWLLEWWMFRPNPSEQKLYWLLDD